MSATFRVIPTANIRPSKRNVREDLGDLTELAASVHANGIQQPVIVTDVVTHFELIDGHRRHAAAVRVELPHLPAIVTDISGTRPTLVMMLAAAMHKQLAPLEQARAFDALRNDGMTINEIAAGTGYSRLTVTNRLLLLELPDQVLGMVEEGDLTLGEAQSMARDVRRTGNASGTKATKRATWLAASHPLAKTVSAACTCDPTTVVRVGGVGCGRHWEEAIRADARRSPVDSSERTAS